MFSLSNSGGVFFFFWQGIAVLIDYFQAVRMFLTFFYGIFSSWYKFVYFLFTNCIIWGYLSHGQNHKIGIKLKDRQTE